MIKVIRIDDIAELIRHLCELPNNYIYRGHADANWKLESSLERVLGRNWSTQKAGSFEDIFLSIFKSKFHLYDNENIEPDSKLAWLSLMQHYGVPTRLLDFTESPFVAIYFALEAYDFSSGKDFAVFAIDYTKLMDASIREIADHDVEFNRDRQQLQKQHDKVFDDTVDKSTYKIAWVAEPGKLNARIDRQAGTFLLTGDKGSKIEDILKHPMYDKVEMLKFEICSSICEGTFALLRKMNINSKTVYGDLGGLAKSLKMQMQIYANGQASSN